MIANFFKLLLKTVAAVMCFNYAVAYRTSRGDESKDFPQDSLASLCHIDPKIVKNVLQSLIGDHLDYEMLINTWLQNCLDSRRGN
ncbi:unnamed protein product [Heterobilharzia americana]|nr:unnamed protein product [Heterobilharzia americana]CAH8549753.1 unnamed protein product [Heterobilharzia americana]